MKQAAQDRHYTQIKRLIEQPYLKSLRSSPSLSHRYLNRLPPVSPSKKLEKELINTSRSQEQSVEKATGRGRLLSKAKSAVKTRCMTEAVPPMSRVAFTDGSRDKASHSQSCVSIQSPAQGSQQVVQLAKSKKQLRLDMKQKLLRKDSNKQHSLLELLRRVENYRFHCPPKKVFVLADNPQHTRKTTLSPRSLVKKQKEGVQIMTSKEVCTKMISQRKNKRRPKILISLTSEQTQNSIQNVLELQKHRNSIAPWEQDEAPALNFPSIVKRGNER